MSDLGKGVSQAEADAVIDRLREALGCASDADLVRALDLTAGAVANWRKRATVPYSHCVAAARAQDWSLDWLLLGRGPRRHDWISDAPVSYASADPQALTDAAPTADDATRDPRLAAVIAWWMDWWDSHNDEWRSWALVQLHRAIPESADWVRRWIATHRTSGDAE